MYALRDVAATFISRMLDSFRFLAPAIFRGRSLSREEYLDVDVTLFQRPGAQRGPDFPDGTVNSAEVRTRSSWTRPTIPPWSVDPH